MIIIINGCSSAGKTSIVKAMQNLHDKPLLHAGVDRFWAMIPDQYKEFGAKADEGYLFVQDFDSNNNPIISVHSGLFGMYMDHSKAQIIKCFAERGHHVAVDEIFTRDDTLRNYVKELQGHKVYFVGIVCDLHELEKREIARGNRPLGLVRGAIDFVHRYESYYDLVVDSTDCDVTVCAQKILDFVNAHHDPQGFKKLESICSL